MAEKYISGTVLSPDRCDRMGLKPSSLFGGLYMYAARIARFPDFQGHGIRVGVASDDGRWSVFVLNRGRPMPIEPKGPRFDTIEELHLWVTITLNSGGSLCS